MNQSNNNNDTTTHNDFSNALNFIQQSQSILDDNKETLSSDLYLNLSNINNQLYKDKSNNFYRITYMDYKVSQPASGIYLSRPHIKTEILTLTDEMYSIYKRLYDKNMSEKGFYLPTIQNLLGLDLKRLNTNPLVNIYGSCCSKNPECCDCDSESFCEAPETHCISLDFDCVIINIKKL